MSDVPHTPAARTDGDALLPSSGRAHQSPAPPVALGLCQGSDALGKQSFERFCCVLNSTASPFYSLVAGLNFQGLLFQICVVLWVFKIPLHLTFCFGRPLQKTRCQLSSPKHYFNTVAMQLLS